MMFKSLVCTVSEQCQEIKQAIALFPYFENWDANVVAECCRVSSLSEFLANEIILGPGVGDSHTVHFLLNGICKMVHHLQIELSANSHGKLFYKFFVLRGSRTPNFEKRTECYLSRMFNQERVLQDQTNGVTKCPEAPKEEAEGMEVNDDGQGRGKIFGSEHEIEVIPLKKEHCESLKAECSPAKSETKMSESEKKIIFESDHHLKLLEECKQKRKETTCVQEQSTSPERPANVKSVFIETGTLFMGATFGLGKLGKENFIISSTAVKILKIPLRFLLQYNSCNIWNRISLFHSLYLLGEDEIFEHFQNGQKWIEKKKKQTEGIIALKNIPNHTLINDVPYWIRLSSTR